MKGFYIPNHSSGVLRTLPFEEMIALPARPSFPTKDAMLGWAHDAATDHCFYNLSEPADATRRCTKENGVRFIHGLVADFDSVIDENLLAKGLKKVPADFPVAYVSSTFSKGLRMVWLFSAPVPVFTREVAKAFLDRAAKELKLSKVLPGFDHGAFVDPSRYFELGTDWLPVKPESRIPSTTAAHWLFEVSGRADWRDQGVAIPIDAIAAEVDRRFPGRWEGPFAVGVQGVRFWDPTAKNPKGAWVRETGMQAFSGEGRFLPWAEIFGQEFVTAFERQRIGGATENIFYDGKVYWTKAADVWIPNTTEVIRRQLRAAGLQVEARRGEMPELDRALHQIETTRRIDGVFPFLYSDAVIREVDHQRLLNISRLKPLRPLDGAHEWGEGFPWLAEYLNQLLDPEQLEVYLSWAAHGYQGALEQKPRRGHAFFLAGPHSSGKTFLSLRVNAPLFGGYQEATRFLTGQTEFNAALMKCGYWTVDDAEAATDGRAHDLYSQVVKKVVANPSLTYREMYVNPITLPWQGRVFVTLNNDPKSIAMLPNVEQSMLDKVIFVLARPTDVNFRGAEEKLVEELPAFAAYLRDWKIPEKLNPDWRFGFQAYHHPELKQTAIQSASSASTLEILSAWRVNHFRGTDLNAWKGTAMMLHQDILACESLAQVAKINLHSTRSLARDLGTIIQQKAAPWLSVEPGRTESGRTYVITRP